MVAAQPFLFLLANPATRSDLSSYSSLMNMKHQTEEALQDPGSFGNIETVPMSRVSTPVIDKTPSNGDQSHEPTIDSVKPISPRKSVPSGASTGGIATILYPTSSTGMPFSKVRRDVKNLHDALHWGAKNGVPHWEECHSRGHEQLALLMDAVYRADIAMLGGALGNVQHVHAQNIRAARERVDAVWGADGNNSGGIAKGHWPDIRRQMVEIEEALGNGTP